MTESEGEASNLYNRTRSIDLGKAGGINAFFTKSTAIPSSEATNYTTGSIFITTGQDYSDSGDLAHGILHAAGIAAGVNGYATVPDLGVPSIGGVYDYLFHSKSAEATVVSIKNYLEGDPQRFYGYASAKAGAPPSSTARHSDSDIQILKAGFQKYKGK